MLKGRCQSENGIIMISELLVFLCRGELLVKLLMPSNPRFSCDYVIYFHICLANNGLIFNKDASQLLMSAPTGWQVVVRTALWLYQPVI